MRFLSRLSASWRLPQSHAPFVAFALLALLAVCNSAAASWPVRHFELVNREPFKNPETVGSSIDAMRGLGVLNSSYAARWNARLDAIGRSYANASLKAPLLGPVVDSANTRAAFAVFLFGFNGSRTSESLSYALGGYEALPPRKGRCGPPPRDGWIRFNSDKTITGPQFFDTVAHEMFHAVQASYAFERNCKSDTWISEGMTEGAAQYVFKTLHKGTDLGAIRATRHNLGMRPYFVPLYAGTSDNGGETFSSGGMKESRTAIGYGTASFWEFLAEASGSVGYLGTVMSRKLRSLSPMGEIRWLDGGLENDRRFHKDGLYALYPEFITSFASWGGSRFRIVPTAEDDSGHVFATDEEAREQWLRLAFKKCRSIKIGLGEVKTVNVEIAPVAAQCLRVRYDVPPGDYASDDIIRPVLEALGRTQKAVDGLHLGVARSIGPGKTVECWTQQHRHYHPGRPRCILKANQFKRGSRGGRHANLYVRSWNDAITVPRRRPHANSTATEKVYILSNVRLKAWKTKTVHVIFRVGLSVTRSASGETEGQPEGRAVPHGEGVGTAQSEGELAVPPGRQRRRGARNAGPRSHAQKRHTRIAPAPSNVESHARDAAAQIRRMATQLMFGMKGGAATTTMKYGLPTGGGTPVSMNELGSFRYRRHDGKTVTIVPVSRPNGHEMQFGETGPFDATVEVDGGAVPELSQLCHWGKVMRAGRILKSDDDKLVVKLDVDVCAMNANGSGCSQQGCHRVEHIGAKLILVAGWRYYASYAPVTEITPGIKDYMRRFTGQPYGGAPASLPPSPSQPDKITHVGGQGHSTSKSAGGQLKWADTYKCNCTCDEFNKFTKQTLYAPSATVDRRMQKCTKACKKQYGVCLEGHP